MPLQLLRRKPQQPKKTSRSKARLPLPSLSSGRMYSRQDRALACAECGCHMPADSFMMLLAESLN